ELVEVAGVLDDVLMGRAEMGPEWDVLAVGADNAEVVAARVAGVEVEFGKDNAAGAEDADGLGEDFGGLGEGLEGVEGVDEVKGGVWEGHLRRVHLAELGAGKRGDAHLALGLGRVTAGYS